MHSGRNDSEFTNRFSTMKNKLTLFEVTLQQLGIRHKLIRTYTPHIGKVERNLLEDQKRFYTKHSLDILDAFCLKLAAQQGTATNLRYMFSIGANRLRSFATSLSNMFGKPIETIILGEIFKTHLFKSGRSILQAENAPAYYSFMDYALSFSSGLAWAANSAFPSVLS